MKIKWICFILICLMLVSCAGKAPVMSRDAALKKAIDRTPNLCAYNGKVAINAKKNDEKAFFNASLNKSCDNNAKVSIYGLLNFVIARFDYTAGVLKTKANDKFTERSLQKMGEYYIPLAVKLLKSPLFALDNTFTFSSENGVNVFKDSKGRLAYPDSTFKLYKYSDANFNAVYEWEDDNIVLMNVSVPADNISLSIRFIDKAWRSNE